MELTRRSLFSFAALPLVTTLPKIPCHKWDIVEKGDFNILHLAAPQEMPAPRIEIERWSNELKTCEICGETWVQDIKAREHFPCIPEGQLMHVPPVIPRPETVIVFVNDECRVWINGAEYDWAALPTTPHPTMGGVNIRDGFLPIG